VHITEFNTSYRPDNPVHDTALQAAYLAPVLAAGGDLVDSFAYWTFCDVFEEAGVPASVMHGGFGLVTHRQIKKPAFHLYAFMARLGQEILARGEDHLVTRDGSGRVAVLAWAPLTVDSHSIALSIPLAAPDGAKAFVLRSRVNEEMGNAWTAWTRMGRPASPTARQLSVLRETAEAYRGHQSLTVRAGRVGLDLALDRHEVTLVEVSPVVDETPPWWDDRVVLPSPGVTHE
jgi:xylan 1,4-beta-xylosidase